MNEWNLQSRKSYLMKSQYDDLSQSLLVRLSTYRPREKRNPLEDFITEAFAWILNNDQKFAEYFVQKLDLISTFNVSDYYFETQVSFIYEDEETEEKNIFRPDMVLKSGTKDQIIFEHKTWSHLHEKQLDNYRLSSSAQHLVLITASNYQHTQKSDNLLIWC